MARRPTPSIALSAILVMVFLANLVCMRLPRIPVTIVYGCVAACIGLHAAVPAAVLLPFDPAARLALAVLVLFGPIFFAGLAFSSAFRTSEKPHMSFGSNLLGAMIGGGLEYASMAFGFALLDVLAFCLYALAFLSFVRGARTGGLVASAG